MRRWVLNLGVCSVRIHHWYSSDDHRAFHDHPWSFVTIVLRGSYVDVSANGRESMRPGAIRYRHATHSHTTEVAPDGCWTLILAGPTVRKWGFWKGSKWVKANKYFLENGHHPCV